MRDSQAHKKEHSWHALFLLLKKIFFHEPPSTLQGGLLLSQWPEKMMLIWPPPAARVDGRWLFFLVSLWRQEGRRGVGNDHWVTSQPPTCHPFPAQSGPSFCFIFLHGTKHLLIVYVFLFSYVILFLPLEESSSLLLYLQQLAQSWLLIDDKNYWINVWLRAAVYILS